jgi:hypothetical protein
MNAHGTLRGDIKIFKPTPKLHILAAHAPDFAEEHGWWSVISEQGIEHLHQVHNRLVSF